jgi:hypothetical protein
VKEQPFPTDLHGEGNTVRRVAPVGLAQFDAVPDKVRPAEELDEAYALALRLQVSQDPSRVKLSHEPMYI